ncbi:FecR domain-containing protein [Porticoccaceae bacterium]|nr:FecR domain-containing protein [Porticoccaceae bacterium]
MENVTEFLNRSVIEQEAVEWLIRLDGDTPPTQQELQALKGWMGISPVHTEEIEKLGAFWNNHVLTELNIPLVKSDMESLTEGPVHSQGYQPDKRHRERAPLFSKPWAIAASILGLTILFQQMLLPLWNTGGGIEESNGYYATGIGKQTTIPLADGSIVHLNTNSQIKIEYSEQFRNIRLIQGEAYFEVAKNKAQPFRVYAGAGRVQAVGTAFTVYLHEKDVDVLVTEGKVELAARLPNPLTPDSQAVVPESELTDTADINNPKYYLAIPVEQLGLLEAGEGATILFARDNISKVKEPGSEVKPMDVITRKRRDAWRKGLVLFTGDSLEEVVNEISRYTTVSIEIVDPALKKIRIGGQFRVGDLNGMFEILETNFDLSVTRLDDNHVQISAVEK